ncbi:MAG: hypothetical protein N2Z59_00880 [Alteraurantiacibacter sp.]|nr:hypothetical protein [Alteraurantiacibacter sp.]
MNRLDRRTMIKGSVVAGMTFSIASSLPVLARMPSRTPAVVLFDGRLIPADSLHVMLHTCPEHLFDLAQHDLAHVWLAAIPDLLRQQAYSILGITAWSAKYISESLGRELGLHPVKLEGIRANALVRPLQGWQLA